MHKHKTANDARGFVRSLFDDMYIRYLQKQSDKPFSAYAQRCA
jgi:hypothetical protein